MGEKVSVPPYPIELVTKKNGNTLGDVANPVVVDPQLDKTAFGELLTAINSPIFQGSFEYTVDNTTLTTNAIVNGGTVTQAEGMGICTTSTTTASSAYLISKNHAKYRAGQGGMARFTALFTTPVAGTEQYIGLMDEIGTSEAFENGYGIGYDGTTFGVHRWQNDSLITVALADCDDPLDGTGASGMTLDQTKLNVYQVQFQYLGAGAINFCIENDSTGKLEIFHTILYANNYIVPSVYSPNFHFTIWVDNKATTSNIILKSASYAYFVQGLTNFTEIQQPQFGTGLITKTTVTTEVAIFTIRSKALYASKSNFIDILLESISASIEASSANNLGSVRLVKNSTLGGAPSWSDINTTDSTIEIDTAGTTVTGGIELFSAPLAGKNDKALENISELRITLNDLETLTIAGLSENSATIKASSLWKELF